MNSIAEQLLPLAEAHRAADEYQAGDYKKDDLHPFQGCSIGCTIYDARKLGLLPPTDSGNFSDHKAVAGLLFGGVEGFAHLQDIIFEHLQPEERAGWTPRILRAVADALPGKDFQLTLHRWMAATLQDVAGLADVKQCVPVSSLLALVLDLHHQAAAGHPVSKKDWYAAGRVTKREAEIRTLSSSHEPAVENGAWCAHHACLELARDTASTAKSASEACMGAAYQATLRVVSVFAHPGAAREAADDALVAAGRGFWSRLADRTLGVITDRESITPAEEATS